MYGLQHGALAHTEQQAIKGPKITRRVKPFKQENQRLCLNCIFVTVTQFGGMYM